MYKADGSFPGVYENVGFSIYTTCVGWSVLGGVYEKVFFCVFVIYTTCFFLFFLFLGGVYGNAWVLRHIHHLVVWWGGVYGGFRGVLHIHHWFSCFWVGL